MRKIISTLQNLGFTKKEIKIYLSLTKLQNQTALQLSKTTKIDRTTIYDILKKLTHKGIASSTIKNRTTIFNALTPKELLTYFQEKYSSLESIVPKLDGLKQPEKEPLKCELFEGISGIKFIIKDLIESKQNYKAIGISKEIEEILGYLNDHGIINISEFNVKEAAIIGKNSNFKKTKTGKYKELNEELKSPVTTLIYNNSTIFFIWEKPYAAIRIKNKNLFQAQEEYFKLLWKK